MKDEELLKICKEFGESLEKKLGDMSDFSEVEVMFMYFKGGFEYASRHLTPDAADACQRCGDRGEVRNEGFVWVACPVCDGKRR